MGSTMDTDLEFFSDRWRHLICIPYSKENLHRMAEILGIKRCWYHGGKRAHYDIPKSRVREIAGKTIVISGQNLLRLIKEETGIW